MLSKAGFKLKSRDTEISDIVDSSIKAAFEREDEALQDLNKKSRLLQDLNDIAGYPRECKSLPSGAQSFSAFWTSKGRSRDPAGFPKSLGVPQGDVRGVNQLVQKLPVRKHFASVALALEKQFK